MESPFEAFTLMAAPAVLTNAAALLAQGTSNRFSRTLDRARFLASILDSQDLDIELRALRTGQFNRAQIRAKYLLKALGCVYFALGSFALSTLVAILGLVITATIKDAMYITPIASAILGSFGVGSIGLGCVFLVRETRLAVISISDEGEFLQKRMGQTVDLHL